MPVEAFVCVDLNAVVSPYSTSENALAGFSPTRTCLSSNFAAGTAHRKLARERRKRAAALAALSSVGLLFPSNLLRCLHQNPLRRNGEGSTDAGNGIAIQIVVGVIARAGVRVSALVNPGILAHFQRSSRIAAAEGIEREIEVGKNECLLACHFPRAVTRAGHRNRAEGQLVGFRVATSSRVSFNPLEGISRYGHGVEPRPFRPLRKTPGQLGVRFGRVLSCCRRGTAKHSETSKDGQHCYNVVQMAKSWLSHAFHIPRLRVRRFHRTSCRVWLESWAEAGPLRDHRRQHR